jgi:hypothetical protein
MAPPAHDDNVLGEIGHDDYVRAAFATDTNFSDLCSVALLRRGEIGMQDLARVECESP